VVIKLLRQGFYFGPKLLSYQLSRVTGRVNSLPVSLTVSVTNSCNSRCRTCLLWKLYAEKPNLKQEEFKTWEFEKTFQSIKKQIFWVTMSGGEPFLRPDLPEICVAFADNCSPGIINIPTNALLPSAIETKTKLILEKCSKSNVVLNLSLDGIGEIHDEIRNVPGNFKLFLDTYDRLDKLKTEFSNLQLGIHSVVSNFSIEHLNDVYEFSKKLGADSYITEIAEHRTELFNTAENIAPSADEYANFINTLSKKITDDSSSKKNVSKTTRAFRLIYYQIASKELKENRQIIPCFAGLASAQINPFGDVWPCCVLGYDKSMGNLREVNYDFKKIWFSEEAHAIRKYIKSDNNCACPLANAHYTNILFNYKQLARVLLKMF
jgi:MoaA/NifB/PqqE/SkfB family radical SAM enzyme